MCKVVKIRMSVYLPLLAYIKGFCGSNVHQFLLVVVQIHDIHDQIVEMKFGIFFVVSFVSLNNVWTSEKEEEVGFFQLFDHKFNRVYRSKCSDSI